MPSRSSLLQDGSRVINISGQQELAERLFRDFVCAMKAIPLLFLGVYSFGRRPEDLSPWVIADSGRADGLHFGNVRISAKSVNRAECGALLES